MLRQSSFVFAPVTPPATSHAGVRTLFDINDHHRRNERPWLTCVYREMQRADELLMCHDVDELVASIY